MRTARLLLRLALLQRLQLLRPAHLELQSLRSEAFGARATAAAADPSAHRSARIAHDGARRSAARQSFGAHRGAVVSAHRGAARAKRTDRAHRGRHRAGRAAEAATGGREHPGRRAA